MSSSYKDKYSHECIHSLFGSEHEEKTSQIKQDNQDINLESDANSQGNSLLRDFRDLPINTLILNFLMLSLLMTILFLMDVFLLFPIYCGIMVVECCVLSITIATGIGIFFDTDPVYYFWQKNCFYFFIAFNMLATKTQIEKDSKKSSYFQCNLSYLMRQEHLESMGLGGLHSKFLSQVEINKADNNDQLIMDSDLKNHAIEDLETREKRYFFNRVEGIGRELDIDLSLFYFSMLNQNYQNQKMNENGIVKLEDSYLQFLEEQGENTKLSGWSDILWPSYKESKSIWKEDSVPIILYICVVFVKVVLPIWYMKNDKDIEIKFVELFKITGFYVYLIGILYLTLRNEDLEQRNRFMRKFNDLIDFEYCQKTNNSEEYFSKKLDITCTTSLECWDNARRIGCMLDKNKTIRFEESCMYLSFYYIFTALVCQSIYSEIYIIFDENSIYMHPIMVLQTTFDFLMITVFFFVRLNYGSTFNENFPQQVELIDKISSIYEDIIQQYDYYFAPDFTNKVENNLYLRIIQKIQEKSKRYTEPNEGDVPIQYRGVDYTNTDGKVLMIEMMQLNISALNKIRKQIIRDEEQHKHLLFGVFDLPFKETISTALLFFLTLAPTVIKKLESTFNPNAHPPAATPTQIHHQHLHRD